MKFRLGSIVVALSIQIVPACAITIEDLQNAIIQTRVNYDMRIRRAEGTFDTQMSMVWKLKIDSEGRVSGEMTRTVTTPRGPRVQTTPLRGRLGMPGTPTLGGDGIWLIEGDKLVMLRAFEAGGIKAEVEFSGKAPDFKCAIRAPFVREQGKEIRTSGSVVGGPVTVLNAVQKSSDCRLTR
ncbi:MAG: hypothetical protein ABW198_00240 [Pseudorhodoplanes sp.]